MAMAISRTRNVKCGKTSAKYTSRRLSDNRRAGFLSSDRQRSTMASRQSPPMAGHLSADRARSRLSVTEDGRVAEVPFDRGTV